MQWLRLNYLGFQLCKRYCMVEILREFEMKLSGSLNKIHKILKKEQAAGKRKHMKSVCTASIHENKLRVLVQAQL